MKDQPARTIKYSWEVSIFVKVYHITVIFERGIFSRASKNTTSQFTHCVSWMHCTYLITYIHTMSCICSDIKMLAMISPAVKT